MRHAVKPQVVKFKIAENLLFVPLAMVVVGALSLWAFVADRVPPIVFVHGEIEPVSIHPGETIAAKWHTELRRTLACSAVVSREIVDSTKVVWRIQEQEIYDVLYPETNRIGRPVQVPYNAAWGDAEYQAIACYTCKGFSLTRLWPICVRWPKLHFEIRPPDMPKAVGTEK